MQSLGDIPSWMATAWGIDLVTSQVILSTFLFLGAIVPILVLRKDRTAFNVEIIMGFLMLAVCVGLEWLPIWIFIVAILLVSVASAIFGTKVIFGV